MRIGVDYYPEHWDMNLWEQDADRMKEAGVRIVRMAEFAWSHLEPRENEYCFAWLDKAIALFAEREIEVFLGTPTCTPPLWLFEKYPEVIQVDKSGHRIPIGIRGHRCLNNPVYREKCEQIITKMVTRYADNPWVIGYQIDNELEANHCYCKVCEEKFRSFVKKKYGSIDKVNEAYGNYVWSGEYSSFSQVRPPFGSNQTWLNPSYMLDFNRYASESTAEYLEFQRELIRRLDAKALITTNNWLCENMPDFYRMFQNLDFVSYDNYPVTVIPEDKEELYSHAFHLDLMRGIKRKNFWIMEQLSGSLGSWMPMQPSLQPGMLKGYSLQAVAHGADAILHFRWRTAVSGAEMFWHGLIDHSNIPGRRFQEFCDLCKTVEEWKEIEGSELKNTVAILYSSEQEYGFKIQPQVEGMHYFTQLKAYHDAFTCLGVGVDIVNWLDDLSRYDMVVAPTLYITNKLIKTSLTTFVERGGVLILTNRSGVKDFNNQCIMQALPTVFSELSGAVVKEYNPIGLREEKIRIVKEEWARSMQMEMADTEFYQKKAAKTSVVSVAETACRLWCDILEPGNAEVLARYAENYYRGEAAITVNAFGKGRVYYNGTVLKRRGMLSFVRFVIQQSGKEYIEGLPIGVERTVRVKDGKQWSFLFNNTDRKQEFVWNIVKEGEKGEENRECLDPFEMKISCYTITE